VSRKHHKYETGPSEFGDGGMNDPDWDRVLVAPKTPPTKLGDSTLWGARVSMPVPVLGDTVSATVIQAACLDGYARNWAIVGTAGAPLGAWAGIDPYLLVTMGVGQNQITHQIGLNAVIAADNPFYRTITEGDDDVRPFVIPGGIIANALAIRIRVATAAVPANTRVTFGLLIAPFNAGTGL
jgi:hypothetical protein